MFQKLILCFIVLLIGKAASSDETVTLGRGDSGKLLHRMETLENLVRSQQEKIEQLESAIEKQKNIGVVHGETLIKLNSQCVTASDMENYTRRVRRQSYDTVAFSATLNKLNVGHIGVHQNIVFSDVITNIGNGYNNHHGVFVAPVSGLYMFSTTLLSGKNVEFAASIEINGSDVVRMYERGTDNRHGSATQIVIVHLSKGDDVSVQSLSADHTYWGDKYCSFSGVLLQQLESPSQIVG
ncbi:complement C1q-like protein 4 [Ruditapes philippinarum]|uniref:complement C1q-like protein 4 n=1 Tax=Ruditapes philippinarum TaxID=129788 RepID=UPI00295AEC99|nr:complement C1q-like protein 4 [Ruditapes philippinarum]